MCWPCKEVTSVGSALALDMRARWACGWIPSLDHWPCCIKCVHSVLFPQADKEFVWSLWKRLQVASPDITQAVGMVVQR